MQDIHDEIITNVAAFQNELSIETMDSFDAKVKLRKENLKTDMESSYVLTHTLTLQDTLDEIKQELCTDLYLDLQLEKDRIKTVLTLDLDAHQ